MATADIIQEGLALLLRYGTPEVRTVAGEILVLGCRPAQLDKLERDRLERLEWYWDNEVAAWCHVT